MKKSDLKDGMIVEWDNGKMGVFLGDSIRYSNGYDRPFILNEELEYTKDIRIERIYKVKKQDCSLLAILLKENLELIWEREKEIDWTKVPKWTKVQVKYCEDGKWRNRYLIRFNPYKKTPYIVSILDEFTFEESTQDFSPINSYKYCRIHPSVKIPEEWYK